ncbi:phosphoribosylamine--glycine ligase [Bordetella genomosp. 1]|uniref:Phosphoribosylamine--glycine ligase n=2 Tax=Bordetella genomosp. 1 TaxID=1395607 RepID=A0A261S6T9_9BORD|nr:phosphoribosylamine--glycine ligase [Bordetella genomosp. 1]
MQAPGSGRRTGSPATGQHLQNHRYMKLLVIGSGGREHALAWRLARSPRVHKVYVAPGNGGTQHGDLLENVPYTSAEELAAFVQREGVSLTVVGPEAPLAAGVVDVFRAQGLKIFGPTKAAAQLESSKDYAKAFMERHGIPTARYQTFTDPAQAHAYVDAEGAPIVIKADGLAAGKGVVVAMDLEEAHAAIDAMLGDGSLGDAGARVVIEEFLSGEEASFIVMCDGRNVLALATSQDHKRLQDGDQGPNTGGMGAYSPAPIVTPELHHRIMREIILPTVQGMSRDGIPYTGFLYAGLMIAAGDDPDRPIKTLEFNCRMGDPETQPIMMRVKSDLLDALEHAVEGTLDQADIVWDRRTALGVVLASHNYPNTPRTGDVIKGLPAETEDCMVFHAATKIEGNEVKTTGGRVLCVTALGDSVRIARERAYEAVNQVHFDGRQYRSDIGWRALKPSQQKPAKSGA